MHTSGFQIRNENFFVRSRKSRDSAEAYVEYAAQGIPQIDAEIAEKGHFWMETSYHREIRQRKAISLCAMERFGPFLLTPPLQRFKLLFIQEKSENK
jgi:hypothetical protein